MDEQTDIGKPTGFAALYELATDISSKKFNPLIAEISKSTPQQLPNTEPDTEVKSKTSFLALISKNPPITAVVVFVLIGMAWSLLAPNSNTASTAQTPQSTQAVPTQPVVVTLSPPAEEDMPPVGSGLAFTDNEIRYCLSQNIRLDGAQSVLNKYSQADVDRYNAMINDYNSRCGNFQYTPGALQSIQAEVNASSATLQSQGESLFSK